MIIYFTGTGNSKYIASLLGKQLNDSVVSAADMIKSGEMPSFASQKPYVFVSPVYAWRLPRVFERWIQGCTFGGSREAYFVLTCGDSIGAADNYIKRFAERKNLEYRGTGEVVMPENYIVMFSAPSQEAEEGIIAKGTERALQLAGRISRGESFEKRRNTLVGHLCSDIVTPFFYRFSVHAKKFYTTDACVSCGKCAESCMLNNIAMEDGKPVWGSKCTHCMACICKCPTEAIEYGRHTKGLRRYVCPK